LDFGTKSLPIEMAPGETLTGEILVRPYGPARIQTSYQVFVESKGALYIEQIPLDLTIQEGEMPEEWRKQMEERQAQQNDSATADPATDDSATDDPATDDSATDDSAAAGLPDRNREIERGS
jgi:hypothetical protein